MTSEQPMDDLHSLRVTYSSMRRVCRDPPIDRRLALDGLDAGGHGMTLSTMKPSLLT
jgi:hypothetical protein